MRGNERDMWVEGERDQEQGRERNRRGGGFRDSQQTHKLTWLSFFYAPSYFAVVSLHSGLCNELRSG